LKIVYNQWQYDTHYPLSEVYKDVLDETNDNMILESVKKKVSWAMYPLFNIKWMYFELTEL
jgi:hypothetical protein